MAKTELQLHSEILQDECGESPSEIITFILFCLIFFVLTVVPFFSFSFSDE